jgi:hypothetical protein
MTLIIEKIGKGHAMRRNSVKESWRKKVVATIMIAKPLKKSNFISWTQ